MKNKTIMLPIVLLWILLLLTSSSGEQARFFSKNLAVQSIGYSRGLICTICTRQDPRIAAPYQYTFIPVGGMALLKFWSSFF